MAHNNLSRKINEYINSMPSLPVSAGKVLEICSNIRADASDLNHVISLDPVLTGRLLKLLNSAYYGLNNHITSLVRAIIMLGVNTVKNLALTTAVMGTLQKNKKTKSLNMENYWQHCLCVGVTSKLLAVKQGVDFKLLEEYFTAGLLHDIGKIPLNAVLVDNYLSAIKTAEKEQKSLFRSENDNLDINHCAAGSMIAAAWKLDGPVADTIKYHHNPSEYPGEDIKILYTVSAADYFTSINSIGFAGNKNPEKPDSKIWETLGLKEDIFEELKEKISQEIEKAKIFLNI
jgi:putative nucleotidyltransferase with HDIG domain